MASKADLWLGDCRAVLPLIAADSVDSVVTDPPYSLVSIAKRFGSAKAAPTKAGTVYARSSAGFMGQQWDTGETAFDPEFWAEVLRVLKPGGHLLAFGGTRTHHRLACAVEDAGFEIRDQIGWVFGSGFPKSHNQDGEWEGWGTALKPAWEPIVLARKSLIGTVAANLAAHRVGAINIAACRVEAEKATGWGGGGSKLFEGGLSREGGEPRLADLGRWPANLIHDGSDEVLAAFPDGGSAARFFYCAKSSKKDRNEGLDDLPDAVLARSGQAQAEAKRGNVIDVGSGAFNKARIVKNNHPTVKPVDLMRYLCRLITPPGGTILDPFAGSGSTGKGAAREGFDFIGIEREASYWEIANARLRAEDAKVIFQSPLWGARRAA